MLKLKTMKSSRMPVQPMSMKTRDFIQKICYRRTASVDMTRNGFISDSKMQPIGLMLKPLKDKLKKICDCNHEDRLGNKSGGVKKRKGPNWSQNRARQKYPKLTINANDTPAQANARKILYKLQKRNARLAMYRKDIISPVKESKKRALPLVRFKLKH